MLQPIPYLAFDGDCAEAMAFYQQVLGGELGLMTGANSPMADQIPPDQRHRVLHARLDLGQGMLLYGGDAPVNMAYQGVHGVSIALNFDQVAKAEQVFNALAEGGEVTMAFSDTFWAKKFGMLTDRYGCHWIINGEMRDMPLPG